MTSPQPSLPREVLQWLQILDMSAPIKNPKRDIANGYLVAEIFARHFPSELGMHSFNNVTSTKRKLDNWELLDKFFKKKNVPISKEAYENVIACKLGAAEALIEAVYIFLTGKSIQRAPPPPPPPAANPNRMSRPTASTRVKNVLGPTEIKPVDAKTQQKEVREVIEVHTESLRADRVATMVDKRACEKSMLKPSAVDVPDADLTSLIQFKEVTVRQLARYGTSLNREQQRDVHNQSRQSRPGTNTGGARVSRDGISGAGGHGGGGNNNGGTGGAGDSAGNDGESLIDILDSRLQMMMENRSADRDKTAQIVGVLCSSSRSSSDSDEKSQLAKKAFAYLNEMTNQIADCCVMSAMGFVDLFAISIPCLLQTAPTSFSFTEMVKVLIQVGRSVAVLRRSHRAFTFLRDFGLALLAPLLQAPYKVDATVDIIVTFMGTPNSEACASQFVGLLQSLEPHVSYGSFQFLLCAAKVLQKQKLVLDFAVGVEYFESMAVLGVTSPSPYTRTAALCLVSTIARHLGAKSKLVFTLSDRIEVLLNDEWWEVHAQLLLIASWMLEKHGNMEKYARWAQHIILHIMKQTCTISLLLIGMSVTVGLLKNFPELSSCYASALLSIPDEIRRAVLSGDSVDSCVQLMEHAVGVYQLPRNTPMEWHALSVVNGLMTLVELENLGSLSPSHLEVLNVACSCIPDTEHDVWAEWFNGNAKRLLYIALCHENACHLARTTLLSIFKTLPDDSIATFPKTFAGAIRLAFNSPTDNEVCRNVICSLIKDAFDIGQSVSTAIFKMVRALGVDMLKHPQLNEVSIYVQKSYAGPRS